MNNQITTFIDELKTNKKMATFDEASTKQAVVLRLLSFLGWDIFNVEEVYPDFSTGSSNISYALRIRNTNKVFIEVKRVHKKLDSYQKELVDLAARDGVNMAVLTNGITWWFYLVSAPGNWKQKWFLAIDLMKQKTDSIVPHLLDLLEKDKITKGQSLRAAKTLFQKKKQKLAADFLPEAWNQILTQPNKIFVELLSEQTEKLCRYKVDSKTVEKFINKYQDKWLLKSKASNVAEPPAAAMEADILDLHDELPKSWTKALSSTDTSLSGTDTSLSGTDKSLASTDTIKLAERYADKTIKSYTFNGNTYKVSTWDEMLTTLCDYFAAANSKDFEKVLWISNEQKPRFSRYGDQLRMPEKVKRTDIYVETKLNPGEVVRTCGKLLAEFGFSKDDLQIETA
jgi:predicted type IV restriction endonuclease